MLVDGSNQCGNALHHSHYALGKRWHLASCRDALTHSVNEPIGENNVRDDDICSPVCSVGSPAWFCRSVDSSTHGRQNPPAEVKQLHNAHATPGSVWLFKEGLLGCGNLETRLLILNEIDGKVSPTDRTKDSNRDRIVVPVVVPGSGVE